MIARANGQPVTETLPDACTDSIVFRADGKIAACADKKQALLLEAKTGKTVAKLVGHDAPIGTFAFHPNGTVIATGSEDETAALWSLSGKLEHRLRGHASGYVNSVAFSPDGTLLVTRGHDRTVRLWRVADGKPLWVAKGHLDWVQGVLFTADGQHVISHSETETRLWNTTAGAPRATLTLFRGLGLEDGKSGWLLTTPDGKVDGSDYGLSKVHFVRDNQIVDRKTMLPKRRHRGLLKSVLNN